MAVTIGNKVLLNPAEKATKFADELRGNVRFTNDQHIKFDKNGNPSRLTKEQRAFRSGYLAARKDNAKCFKAKKK